MPTVAALALLGPWLLHCGEPPLSEVPSRPDVLIYLVDTLRRDRIGVYGYARDTTPELDAFARDAVVFENAYSPTSWTRPAVASLLTGLSPARHRATGSEHRLSSELELLSERFQAAGYHSEAFVTNPHVIPLWGFDQGFDRFHDIDAVAKSTRADTVVERVARALETRPSDRPFFFFVHTLDPHEPYDPPAPFGERFATSTVDGPGLYDGEIAFGDLHFGRLLDRMRALGLYEDAIVVFVSDHGEEFWDHGGISHGRTLFEEVVRVPLIVKLPRSERAGERIEVVATLMDVAPTLLAASALPVPAEIEGIDLLAAGGAASRRPIFFDLTLDLKRKRSGVIRAVRLGPLKFVRQARPRPRSALFDLERDPRELVDIQRDAPDSAQLLESMIDARLAANMAGVHLRAVHAFGAESRRCSVQLKTDGRFEELRTALLEEPDRVRLGDEGRSLHVELELSNRPHPIQPPPEVVVDEDAVAFEVRPEGAVVELTVLAVGEQEPCAVWLGPERAPLEQASLRFEADAASLAVRDVSTLTRRRGLPSPPAAQGVYLAVVREPQRVYELPDSVRRRLEALSYIE